ncbi:glycoside hydrolase family 3 protein [Neolentinus lepideus HHB14362 ss-1]|uniref:beta-glucosidase n=1 Tax=Neolentinus lepideus HHB14362 ss-1 TaxID=1314782 RepID=A0A165USF0_9AGAM|nr:glycoside hydrolase family 3 protein [Neolentinus lepideus HHB14362 ss-1]
MSQPKSRSFLEASVPALVKKLRTEEKIQLLGAPDWWNTHAIERLEIPAVRMSDGPNGVRGSSHFQSTPAQCLPCATSLAATFDPELIHQVGAFLAAETKIKSSVILLAPTCNIQRNPLGGRAFESFSEDPHLSGTIAAAYVNGLQENGVAATIKHFVANDQEHERTAADSVLSERALREIYLYPFMLAQRDAKPWAFMTSYGRIDNVHCSENPRLLQDILRKEWGFDGLVMSDWYGTYSVAEALNAGLDLEMPGPSRWRTPLLVNHSLTAQKTSFKTLNTRVSTLLSFVQKVAKINPDVVYGDGVERSRDSPEARNFCRKLAAEGIVLLKNEGEVLPLRKEKARKVAIIGPNVKGRVISGGGSAALKPTYVVTPYQGLIDNAPEGIELKYSVGCYAHRYLPTLENNLTTKEGQAGWLCTFYQHDESGEPVKEPLASFVLQDTRIRLNDFLPKDLTPTWTIKVEGNLTFEKTAEYELGLAVAGRAKLWVDGELAIDNWTKQTKGEFFYGQGTVEEKATLRFGANKSRAVSLEYTNTFPPATGADDEKADSQPALMRGVRLGGAEKIDPDQAIDDAVKLATQCDAVVVVVGLTPEWESEGFDRPTLHLPGLQDKLIAKVAEANSNTIVCVQAGSAVAMPWISAVSGLVQTWYSGNEVGNALADVLYGNVNPSGRLTVTLPSRYEDIPAYPNLFSEDGRIHYREDLFVGYKYFDAKGVKPLFPFGFGLSYTRFTLSGPSLTKTSAKPFGLDVTVTVRNVGLRVGSEVVQVYVGLPDVGVTTPKRQLRAFAKAKDLAPGESKTIKLTLDKYAVSFWDTPNHCWRASAGEYALYVGPSSDNLPLQCSFILEESFEWTGL